MNFASDSWESLYVFQQFPVSLWREQTSYFFTTFAILAVVNLAKTHRELPVVLEVIPGLAGNRCTFCFLSRWHGSCFIIPMTLKWVGSAVIIVLASMQLLLLLAAGIGLTDFNTPTLAQQMDGFLVWAAISWIASIFLGCLFSVVANEAPTLRHCLLISATTWAASFLVGDWYFSTLSTTPLISFEPSQNVLLGVFVTQFAALGTVLLAAYLGQALNERRVLTVSVSTSTEEANGKRGPGLANEVYGPDIGMMDQSSVSHDYSPTPKSPSRAA